MLVNNNPVDSTIIVIDDAPKISSADEKVSKVAKGFFAQISACITAPFKFIARVIKSGFMALINLCKREGKNQGGIELPFMGANPSEKIDEEELQLKPKALPKELEAQLENEAEAIANEVVQSEAEAVANELHDQVKQEAEAIANEVVQSEAEAVANELDDQVKQEAEAKKNGKDDNSYNSLNGIAALGLAATTIQWVANMAYAPSQGAQFSKESLPVCYANESIS